MAYNGHMMMRNERENMIDFVAAKDGGLEFTTICDTRIFGFVVSIESLIDISLFLLIFLTAIPISSSSPTKGCLSFG